MSTNTNHDQCPNHHARNDHADRACDLATKHDVPWAMASWALAGGRVDHAALAADAHAFRTS